MENTPVKKIITITEDKAILFSDRESQINE